MKEFLTNMAWPMKTPVPYSLFHICLSLAGISLAVSVAWKLKNLRKQACFQVLFGCGLVLGISEIFKQLFLYVVVNNGVYDWWYFPFQLCSLPMYFCLLLPWIPAGQLKKTICTFMQDFHLLGGFMALAEPSGLMHPYWVLTLHGFFWHFALIFISLFIGFNRQSELTIRGYFKTLPLFGVCCLIASFINVNAHTLGDANMFYISPYYPSGQIVFHQVALKLGIMAGNLIYLLSICLGGLTCHIFVSFLVKRLILSPDNSSGTEPASYGTHS